MGYYDRQIATAKRIIATKGQLCSWVHIADGTGGTAAAPAANVETTYANIPMCFLPLDREYLSTFQSLIKDTEIPTGIELVFMGQVPFEPEMRDKIIRGSVTYSILPKNGIDKIDPNGEGAILYIIRAVR
jgi:hypothetical protein